MDPRLAAALANPSTANYNLGGSPNGSSTEIGNLQRLAQINFRAGAAGNAMGMTGATAKANSDIEEGQRKAAEAAAEAAAKVKAIREKAKAEYEAALSDPDNFKREVSDDGGYNFFDPTGKPISVREYSKATGKQIDKALEGSNNPNDAKFTSEYKTLMDYGRALAGDEDSIKKFKEDEKYKGFLEAYKDKPYGQVVTDFKKAWDGYMQPNQLDQLPATGAGGRNIQSDAISPDGPANPIMDWLLNRQRQRGVNYR